MSDKSYDAVIVGGGHNGLVLGSYLAMNGIKVGIFEEKWELGGGACSEEYTAPGYISNPCATSVRFGYFPPYRDLNLRELGLEFIYPKKNGSAIFDDDTCIITRPCQELDKETLEPKDIPGAAEANYDSVAQVSQRDADKNEQIRELNEKYWKDAIMRCVLSPPPPIGEEDPIVKLMNDPAMGMDPRYRFMTIGEIAYDLYESDHMRTYWMRSAMSATGCLPNTVSSPASLAFSLSQLIGGSPAGITVGGTHSIAHALQKFISTRGGQFWVHSPVEKILIENGKANGIRLKDGTEIEAKMMVISNLDPLQTIELMGEENYDKEMLRKVKNLDTTQGPIWWGSMALHEPPDYKITSKYPDAVCFRNYLLPADAQYTRYKYPAEVFTRGYSDRIIHPYHNSTFDPDRAPKGKYEIQFEEYAPPAFYWDLRGWLQKKDEFFEAMLKRWQEFAPNMTWDNIIAVHFNSPIEIQMRNRAMQNGQQFQISNLASQGGQLRPLPELSRYKMPVDNYYLTSSSAHPMGAMIGWVGYSCYKRIAEDYGLRKIWEEKGREY